MNILYIAMGCAPDSGSEDKIGWSIPIECAKTNNVYVITMEKFRTAIEASLVKTGLENIHFYYVDIPEIYKKLFKGFLFSGRIGPWNRRALLVAREICAKNDIQIIHQITPVEFRGIGSYGRIPNVKFVCGPVGGAQVTPRGLRVYSQRNRYIEQIRSLANAWYKIWLRMSGRLSNCDMLLFANCETKEYLGNQIPLSRMGDVCTEIGLSLEELGDICYTRNAKRCFLVVGRLVYLKGHTFLLDALRGIPDEMEYECLVVGDGAEYNRLKKCVIDEPKLLEKVRFIGKVPYNQIDCYYRESDVLIMPSIRETTGTVILEAMSKGLPVITINKFGGATILDSTMGWLYEGNTKEEYICNLRNAIIECIQNPEEVKRRGQNARIRAEDFTWEKKVAHYQKIYDSLIADEG